ncbi:sulfatase-like hydrolase/transferase [Halobellus ordinarius]|uniref:sulfatase-like hydrolase/transferase n=1 Tax=Halobellus ordinarius TaxID=3075120 RepID=UPI002880AC73|nr:sulfatase-like hydrolase/transferase [Halobellus sp. ZY16]
MSDAGAGPNVLLVVLDSVRARNTSLHGHHNETTPYLESLAKEGRQYEQARAPGTESISSHTSAFTGYHVREHGITNRRNKLMNGHTIWERLAADGYHTGVFSNNPFLTELPVGLSEAFDTVVGRSRELPYPDAVNPKDFVIDADDGPKKYFAFFRAAFDNGRPVGSLVNGLTFRLPDRYEQRLPAAFRADASATVYAEEFLNWEARVDGAWAACVNFMDAHFPYEGDPYDLWGDKELERLQDTMDDQVWEFVGGQRPWWQREALEALYDGAIRRCDAELERIVETLRRRGQLEDTLVVVTADHGEGFGERSLVRPDQRCVGHGNGGLMEELLHVPLVVRHPAIESGDVVETPATLTAFPTVVDSFVTEDLDPTTKPFVPEGPVVAATDGIDPDTQERAREFLGDLNVLTASADAVYTRTDAGVRKAVRWGNQEALITVQDARTRWRVGNAADVDEVTERFEDRGVHAEADDVDDAVQERLEDLGYA